MTDAHAKAVEAARVVVGEVMRAQGYFIASEKHRNFASAVVTAYLAAMRAEGWVMVRDVGEMPRDNCWDARADGW